MYSVALAFPLNRVSRLQISECISEFKSRGWHFEDYREEIPLSGVPSVAVILQFWALSEAQRFLKDAPTKAIFDSYVGGSAETVTLLPNN